MSRKHATNREAEIGARLKEAREMVGVTQLVCAKEIGVERRTLANYETGVTPLPFDIALRFCREFIISEEWLATGEHTLREAAVLKWFPKGTTEEMAKVYSRLCVDLLTDPVIQQVPRNTFFGEAYDKFLASRFRAKADQHTTYPCVEIPIPDTPESIQRFFGITLQAWFGMLAIEASASNQPAKPVQLHFFSCVLQTSSFLFFQHLACKPPIGSLIDMEWLKKALKNPDRKLGPLNETSNRSK